VFLGDFLRICQVGPPAALPSCCNRYKVLAVAWEVVMRNLRLLVADDHEFVRKGVRTLLEEQPGWVLVAEASDGREAVEKGRDHSGSEHARAERS
jgi:hypothetical protein